MGGVVKCGGVRLIEMELMRYVPTCGDLTPVPFQFKGSLCVQVGKDVENIPTDVTKKGVPLHSSCCFL